MSLRSTHAVNSPAPAPRTKKGTRGATSRRHARQHGRGDTQGAVHRVIAQRGGSPQPVLDPEGGMHERVILLGGFQVEPDTREAVPGSEIGVGYVGPVIPENPTVPGRSVDDDDRGQQRGDEEPISCSEGESRNLRGLGVRLGTRRALGGTSAIFLPTDRSRASFDGRSSENVKHVWRVTGNT